MTDQTDDLAGKREALSAPEARSRGVECAVALTQAIIAVRNAADGPARDAATRDELEARSLAREHNQAIRKQRETMAPAPTAPEKVRCPECGAMTTRKESGGLAVHLELGGLTFCALGARPKKNGKSISSPSVRTVSGGLPTLGHR
jgi:hypothetical protein